jgi:putative PIN family toxin of toxin-antitoxin system
MKKIVLDTNIIIAALMSRRGASFRLLSLIGRNQFDIVISVPLVLEYETVAKRLSGDKIRLSYAQIDDVLDYICKVAIHQRIYYLWRPVLSDPQDDQVLEVAMNAGADVIVTFNVRDFARANQHDVDIMQPKPFLEQIGVI